LRENFRISFYKRFLALNDSFKNKKVEETQHQQFPTKKKHKKKS